MLDPFPHASQHFGPDVRAAPGGADLEAHWGPRCCGIACLSAILEHFGATPPPLRDLLAEGLRIGAYGERGWSHAGLAALGARHGVPGRVGTFDSIEELDALVAAGEAPIVSAAYRFPGRGRRGGHLVVFRGRTRIDQESQVAFMCPSDWGEANWLVAERRFLASCTGRMISFKGGGR